LAVAEDVVDLVDAARDMLEYGDNGVQRTGV